MIAQASPAAGPLRNDPSKRVNYTLGLVLGVDEFMQDQLYHAAGRRGHNRLLHGYGTVWGLGVRPETAGSDPEIQVDPGVAVDPCGREICVPDLMCVKLTAWLDRHRSALQSFYPGAGAKTIPLAVILCHRECQTDAVPVPGEPCRSQDDAMQPSRIRESFELKLALRDDAPWGSPPASAPTGLTVFRLSQPEEQVVRAFGALLARVQTTTDTELSGGGRAALLGGVRALESAADEATLASPPAPTDDPILLPADTATEILREAFRVWVTEVRPRIRALEGPDGCGDADGECCVLLSEVDLPVTGDWAVAAATIESREERRPYLLHTRLLQEWLIAGGGEEGRPDVDTWATIEILGPRNIRIWIHHAGWVDLPLDALTVLHNDSELPREPMALEPYVHIRNVWDLDTGQDMNDGDTVEIRFDTREIPLVYGPTDTETTFAVEEMGGQVMIAEELMVEAARPEVESIRPADREVAEVAPDQPEDGGLRIAAMDAEAMMMWKRPPRWSPTHATRTGRTIAQELEDPTGEYLDRYGWHLSAFTIYDKLEGGDLTGEYEHPIVARIQTFPVDPAHPAADQYLVSDGTRWLPRHLPDGLDDLRGRYPNSRVVRIQGKPVSEAAPAPSQYLVWDGGAWTPSFLPNGAGDISGRYPDITVTRIQNVAVSNAAPGAGQFLRFDGVNQRWSPSDLPEAQGDLAGRYPNVTIAKLQGKDVSAAGPGPNQVLAFVGGKWVPADATPLMGAAGQDLAGAYPAPTVVGIRGRPLSDIAPTDLSFLAFRSSSGSWVPTKVAFSAASDLAGTYPGNTIAKLQGVKVDAKPVNDNDVLAFNKATATWVARQPTAAAGATGTASGDLAGTYPGPQVVALQRVPVSTVKPVKDQYLVFDGVNWTPGTSPQTGDPTGRFVGSPGGPIDIVGAGHFDISEAAAPTVVSSYNGMMLEMVDRTLAGAVYGIRVADFDPSVWSYIIKGTAAGGVVGIVDPFQLHIEVIPLNSSAKRGPLHLEVSRFPLKSDR